MGLMVVLLIVTSKMVALRWVVMDRLLIATSKMVAL